MIDWNKNYDASANALTQWGNILITPVASFYVFLVRKLFKKIKKIHYYIVLMLIGLTIYLGLLVFAWLFFFDLEEFDYSGAFFFWLAIMIFGRRYLPIWVEEDAKEVGDDRTVKDKCGPADDAK
ncbi:hypothetical protein [Oligella urethralis]|uniref:Uncharacterized protein n=1 Tax=Oligella urethralis TaxID=90245 RepID=A0A2X1US49_9BURK|nr:hypothetical protein [Oligella urethralis]SPY07301.1 Uncharacterised protein [Oligella urethralis]SUA54916.1 Uncharacterised protein [Oligella urethralis]SUA64812.1 Uncharacterised protein [Oligella urethralis]SUA66258.1 Uncharacterised protein [Oligella urethralis]SUA94401.1 Uncharacterised protein [Oligella urethralis]